jgi:hypothetical protein
VSAGDPAQGAYTATGQIVADDGFRPPANGFPFQNYGSDLIDGSGPASSLTAAEMQKLFGNAVCADPQCNLTPEAQTFMDKTNHDMGGGHCYGFSVASQLLWSGKANPSDFGAATTAALNIDGNTKLMGEIAYAWTFQTLPAAQSTFITGDPNTILDKLKTLLVRNPPETYTIRIFHGTGGHAVTPYAVEDNGSGQFHVLVYDNNYPGVTRAIAFDTNANTWTYNAALNPNAPDEQYTGNAQTPNIDLDPSSPGLATQPWTFGGTVGTNSSSTGSSLGGGPPTATPIAYRAQGDAAANLDLIYLDGSDVDHGHLLITNPSGQQIGFVNGNLVNTIPGARVQIDALDQDWTETPEPDYYVPDGVNYTITLDGTALQSADPETVGIVAPGYELQVDNINLQPGETDKIVANGDGSMLSYTPSQKQTPLVNLGVSDTNATDYTFSVNGDDVPAGGTINLALPVEGDTFTVSTSGSAETSQLSLAIVRTNDQGEQVFSGSGISLNDGDSAALQFANFTDGGSIPMTITSNGASKTTQLSDQATAETTTTSS